mmetsp:Transcript_15833/g.29873  ORF Transcript_15833/g.29873 Transcript_15833/m.29873 type:complete len:375 (+) Transcript_15833:3603-4727(+)
MALFQTNSTDDQITTTAQNETLKRFLQVNSEDESQNDEDERDTNFVGLSRPQSADSRDDLITNVVDYDESLFEYEALTYFNLPKPRDDEIVIAVQATTISSLKTNIGQEVTIDDVSLDLNSGIAIVGVVKEKGVNVSEDHLCIGDRVATILKSVMKNTRYAQVPSDIVVKVPCGLDSAEAAAAAYTYLISFQSLTHNISNPNIRYLPTLFQSKNVFIVDGTSTLGQAAIQLAKVLGATVFAAGPSSREETIRNLGAIYVGEHDTEWLQCLEGRIHLLIDTALAKCFKCLVVERILVSGGCGKVVYMGMPINFDSLRYGSTVSWKCLVRQFIAQTTLMFISSATASYYDLFSSLDNYPERLKVSAISQKYNTWNS